MVPGRGIGRTITLLAVVAAVVVWQLGALVRERAWGELAQAGSQRLELYASTVANALDKHAYLPDVLTRDKDILALLARPGDRPLAASVDRALEATNRDARSAALYLMDAKGLTLASSNWSEPGSFVGVNYAFRPYFLEAVAVGSGRWFGVGFTTGIPGYFVARAVKAGPRVTGVTVVKVDLEPLQREWASGGELVLVSDANQVAILSSREEWKYGALAQPSPESVARIAATHQYADLPLKPLDLKGRRRLSPDSALVVADGRRYLMQSRPLPEEGWTIHYFSDLAPVEQRVRDVTLLGAAGSLAVSLLVLFLRQRRLRLSAEAAARTAIADALVLARDELERKVNERTRELVETQEELVHAGKMAALGQMSAAMAHELNQPLAAIQTFIASTRIFAERGDAEAVARNLSMIEDLTRRMAGITGHLKAFARKTPGKREAVPLARALERALVLVEPAIRRQGLALAVDIPDSCWVRGDSNRLEQVLVNLLGNAVDALKGVADGRVEVRADEIDGQWAIRVSDNGAGIAADAIDKVFDPFFTTKQVGQGLGLGLSLSYGIVRDFGGTIRAENNPDGGASFVMFLPKATPHV